MEAAAKASGEMFAEKKRKDKVLNQARAHYTRARWR